MVQFSRVFLSTVFLSSGCLSKVQVFLSCIREGGFNNDCCCTTLYWNNCVYFSTRFWFPWSTCSSNKEQLWGRNEVKRHFELQLLCLHQFRYFFQTIPPFSSYGFFVTHGLPCQIIRSGWVIVCFCLWRVKWFDPEQSDLSCLCSEILDIWMLLCDFWVWDTEVLPWQQNKVVLMSRNKDTVSYNL